MSSTKKTPKVSFEEKAKPAEAKPEVQAGAQPYQKKEKAVTVPIDRPIALVGNLAKDSSFKDACVVAFFAPDQKVAIATYVVSRPIGKTKYPAESWVINKSAELADLKARAKNPRLDRILEMRKAFVLKMLEDGEFLKKTPIGDYKVTAKLCKTSEGADYFKWKARAQQQSDAEREKARVSHEAKYKGRSSRLVPKFVWEKGPSFFYDADERTLAAAIEATLASTNAEEDAKEKYPDEHTTQIDGERDQRALRPEGFDWGDYKAHQMLNELNRLFFRFAAGETVKDAALKSHMEASMQMKAEIEKLRSENARLKATYSRDEVISGLTHELGKARAHIEELEQTLDNYIQESGGEENPEEEGGGEETRPPGPPQKEEA